MQERKKMNQRISSNNKNGNKLGFVSMNTGGHNVLHTPEETNVQCPPVAGLAKASPNFKPIEKTEAELSEEEQKKAIAKNTLPPKA